MTKQDKLAAYFQAEQEKQDRKERAIVDAECLAVAVALVKAITELATLIRNRGGDQEIAPAEVIAVLEEARAMMKTFKASVANAVAKTCGGAATRSIDATYNMLSVGGVVVGIKKPTLTADYFVDVFKTIPVGGNLLQEWVAKAFDSATIDTLRREVERGLAEYKTYQQVSVALRDALPATRVQLETVVQTYIHTATVEGTLATYRANSDVVKLVQWNAANEDATCIVCAWLDSQQFPLDDQPPCPNHPRCRCCLSPVVDGNPYADVSIPGIQQMSRMPDTQEWFEQSDKRLESLVGPNRFVLLKAGKINFDDLIDKRTFKIKPLESLLPGQDVNAIIAELKNKGE